MAQALAMTRAVPVFGSLETPDGAVLRTAAWRPSGRLRGTVVMLTGRAEFVEKYQETAEALLARGLQVFSLDWRNQGLSTRPSGNPQKHHLDDFDVLRDDLALFVERVVLPAAEGPMVLLAHSMGGMAATLYLAAEPELFAAAVLSAPMHDIRTAPWPRRAAAILAAVACATGFATAYAPGQRDYDPAEGAFDPDNPITGDPARYAVFHDAFRRRPELRVGGVTFGWVRAALRAADAVRAELPLESVRTPVLLLSAPDDRIVDATVHPLVAQRFGCCTLVTYPDARHEVLMERDPIRDRVWADIDAFLAPILAA
ncbi:alpha/beta fold hydrolase [Azospirillum halopraeferens]|uniref:alpha/beta fold hydrolase n=1 Tax=Azospirillum halopraeferens TaxID=34010 RepID=UPI00040D8272|nr:alpha/beta hydrolase [Azospirillum halopraeferens]